MGLRRIYLVLSLIFIPLSSQSNDYTYGDYKFLGKAIYDQNSALCTIDPMIPYPIKDLQSSLEYNSCFEKKRSYSEFTEEITELQNRNLIFSDLNTCDCLREKATKNSVLGELLARGAIPPASVRQSSLPKNYEKNLNVAIQEKGKILFDTNSLCEGNPECLSLWLPGSQLTFGSGAKKNSNEKLAKSIEEIGSKNPEALKIYNEYLNDATEEKIKLDSDKFSKSLLEDNHLAEGQCVLGREYIAYKQKESFEKVGNLFSSLDLNNFKPDEWDFRKLKKQYDDLMSNSPSVKESNKSTIDLLKNKIIFLNYHPLVKTFLSIDSSSTQASNEGGVSHDFYKDEHLNMKKVELLQNIKTYASPKKSDGSPKDKESLMDEILNKRKIEKFNESLKVFFTKPAVAIATKRQSQQLARGHLFQYRPTAEDLPLTQSAIVQSFLNDHPGFHPDQCTSFGVDERCPEIFGGYCKKLDKIRPKLFVQITDNVPNDLDMILDNSFNPDFKTNADFIAFNKRMCDTKFKTKSKMEISFNDYRNANCKTKDVFDCRSDFFSKKIKDPPAETKHFAVHLNSSPKKDSSQSRLLEKANEISKLKNDETSAFAEYRKKEGFAEDDDFDFSTKSTEKKEFFSDLTSPSDSKSIPSDSKAPTKEVSSQGEFVFKPDYGASSAVSSSVGDKKTNTQKIENMPDEKKKNLLSDWENEYEEWKKNKSVSDTNLLSPADSAKDSLYKKEIETLRALLDEQKKLTETQSKLLNDAISRRNSEVSSGGNQKTGSVKEKISQNSSVFGSNSSLNNNSSRDEDSFSRSPASLSESGKLGNLSNGGSAFKNSSVSGGSGRRSSVENSDSLAREQAKLVNVKNFSDGSILVDQTTNSSPNAITLSVSDDQYKVLLVNPTGLSLNQIEKSIPAEQIGKLEKSGEIILLLKNGSNPPFEVKVERKQNKLVYSLKDKNGNDQKPVRRVFTRKALENELKVQR